MKNRSLRKRALALLLTLVMIFTMMPMVVMGEAPEGLEATLVGHPDVSHPIAYFPDPNDTTHAVTTAAEWPTGMDPGTWGTNHSKPLPAGMMDTLRDAGGVTFQWRVPVLFEAVSDADTSSLPASPTQGQINDFMTGVMGPLVNNAPNRDIVGAALQAVVTRNGAPATPAQAEVFFTAGNVFRMSHAWMGGVGPSGTPGISLPHFSSAHSSAITFFAVEPGEYTVRLILHGMTTESYTVNANGHHTMSFGQNTTISGTVPLTERSVTIKVLDPDATYPITVATGVAANVSVSPTEAAVGETITVTINPPAGQRLAANGVTATGVTVFTGNTAASESVTFTKTAGATVVNATFETIPPPGGGGGGGGGSGFPTPTPTPTPDPEPEPQIEEGELEIPIENPEDAEAVHEFVETLLLALEEDEELEVVLLTLSEEVEVITLLAETLEAILEAEADLAIAFDEVTITIPAVALAEIIEQAGENVEISIVVEEAEDGGIVVEFSITSDDEAITDLPVRVTVEVELDTEAIDAGANTTRIVAIDADGNMVGGSYVNGVFTFETEVTGEFTIAYIPNLIRAVVNLNSPVITDIAGNSPTQVMDVLPIVENGRTLLPLRFIGNALGATVGWDRDTREISITHGGETLSFLPGELAPGMDVPALVVDGRAMVPTRFIAEHFGALVRREPGTQEFEIILAP